jgi:hypothetical protein
MPSPLEGKRVRVRGSARREHAVIWVRCTSGPDVGPERPASLQTRAALDFLAG